jgi:hypothetical protein
LNSLLEENSWSNDTHETIQILAAGDNDENRDVSVLQEADDQEAAVTADLNCNQRGTYPVLSPILLTAEQFKAGGSARP